MKAYRKIILGTGKGRVCYVVAKYLAILVPAVMWKIKNVPNELGDTVKEISNRGVESAFCFFPVAYSKIAGGEKLRAEVVSTKEPGLAVLEDLQQEMASKQRSNWGPF